MAEVKQESKRIKLETTPRDKATEIGKIVCKEFEHCDDDDFEGGAFRYEDISFSVHDWKYLMVMIREDVLIGVPGLINRGSIFPFSRGWQVYVPRSEDDDAGAAFNKNIKLLEMLFREEGALEHYFGDVEGIDMKEMAVEVNGVRYFLALHSEFTLRQRTDLIDGERIIPFALDVFKTESK